MNKRMAWMIALLLSVSPVLGQENWGLFSPVLMGLGEAKINMNDYINHPEEIDSIVLPVGFESRWEGGKQWLLLRFSQESVPWLSNLEIWSKGRRSDLLLRKSARILHTYVFDPQGVTYKTVALAGAMNEWTPAKTPLRLLNGKWVGELILHPGTYPYQIVLDGQWQTDVNNPEKRDNGFGGFNSIMHIVPKDSEALPRLITNSTMPLKINIKTEGRVAQVFSYWNNERIATSIEEGQLQITIPGMALREKRSYIRVFAYNESGMANDLWIPLSYGKVIREASSVRDEWRAQSVYFVLADRFYNGSKENDAPLHDSRLDIRTNFQGGDLAGISLKNKEGYFKNLGFSALWISPLFQNPEDAWQEFPEPHRFYSGYHGYWPVSLSRVDHRFGSNAELKSLVAALHQDSIKILLDYVANHVHKNHPMWSAHPDWFTNPRLPDGRDNMRLWDEQRLTTWFDTFLPSIDHSQPAVAEAMADSALFWLREFDLDGFRHDATKHIEESFWRVLTHKIKNEVEIPAGKPIFQIGETFGSRELIGSYVGSGLLDGQFDFNTYFDMRTALCSPEGSMEALASSLKETWTAYGYHHLMGNISGNHDMPRFISLAGGGLAATDDPRKVGWERAVGGDNEQGYSRLRLLMAIIFTVPGVPVVYYGDEIGMPGADDPDNRRMMIFDGLSAAQKNMMATVSSLNKLRKDHTALIMGDTYLRYADTDIMVYERTYFKDKITIGINKSGQARMVSSDDLWKPADKKEDKYYSDLYLPASDFVIRIAGE